MTYQCIENEIDVAIQAYNETFFEEEGRIVIALTVCANFFISFLLATDTGFLLYIISIGNYSRPEYFLNLFFTKILKNSG